MVIYRHLIWIVALGTIPIAFTGCGGATNSALPAGASARAIPEFGGAGYQTIYDFRNAHRDGYQPNGQLTALKGVLYGTTYRGGHGYGILGSGVVFSVTASGEGRVLYKFRGGADGIGPNGGLIAVHGVLYGTTFAGGIDCAGQSEFTGCGTVFAITPSGQERVIYRFTGGADGIAPSGGLTWLDGRFYGVTGRGGLTRECPQFGYGIGCGTVFAVDTSGNERVLYRFRGNRDGANPNAPLLALGGTLYGTTGWGGKGGSCNYYCGTTFKISMSGVETVLYRFKGGRDGSGPSAPLIDKDGVLYGTTGGGGKCCGTVFKTTTSGDESVVYSFKKLPDAKSPSGPLTADHGLLYGTASGGNACFYYDSGTIFAVGASGNERVVYTYPCEPASALAPGLLQLDHVLYGATYAGGQHGLGTIFTLTP